MDRKLRSAAALLLAALFAVGCLAGCSRKVKEADYAKTVVATYGDEKIYLDEANFMLRREQYLLESVYLQLFGGSQEFWSMNMGDVTLGESTKTGVMSEIYQTRVLLSKAAEYGVALTAEDEEKIAAAIAQFKEGKDAELLAKLGATDALIEKVYRDNALAYRVWEYLTKDIDTTVDEEAYKQITIHYINYDQAKPDDGTEVLELTEGQKQAMTDMADEIIAALESGTDWNDEVTALQEDGTITARHRTETFGKTDRPNEFGTTAWAMKTGEYASCYVEEEGWYVLYCDSDDNKEAQQAKIEEELDSRRAAMFSEKYKALTDAGPAFKVNESIWAQIELKDVIYQIPATEPASEGASESGTEPASESASAAESAAETETASESESVSESATN